MEPHKTIYKVILFFIFICISCGKDSDLFLETVLPQDDTIINCKDCAPANQVVNYVESNEDIANPERGFYVSTITKSSNHTPFRASLYNNITDYTGQGANYSVKPKLTRRVFVLDNFVNSPISSTFLNQIQEDIDNVRSIGWKMIILFHYTDNVNRVGNPPYGDATKAQILAHIKQLEPIFRKNADVIYKVVHGFIGIWGENFYTDHFGDLGNITSKNWADRNETIQALIDVTEPETFIGVRFPQQHQKFRFGVDAATNSKGLDSFSKLAFFNDCFVSGFGTDVGTYSSYDKDNKVNATPNLRAYTATSSNFTPNGGETCYSDPSRSDTSCPVEDISIMSLTWLNADYNNNLNNQWLPCIEDVKKELGYRYVLNSTAFPSNLSASNTFNFIINLKNVGVAPIFSIRNLELVFRNKNTNEDVKVPFTGLDLRKVDGSGNHEFQLFAVAPRLKGEYNVFLNIPDNSENLSSNSKYSVQLANKNIWEEPTGYNNLNQTIEVED